jgi:ABC-type transport system substrate-binding protein
MKRFLVSARLLVVALAVVIVTAVGAPAHGATNGLRYITPTTTLTQDQQGQEGGTLKFNMSGTDIDFSDPTLAYGALSWQIEYATALKLFNYPDEPVPEGSMIVPEAAAGFPVISADGKTYTITVRSGFTFSDGTPVTAENFAFAINRALKPVMQSPAAVFIKGIVGAQDVLDGKAATASGVQVDGDKLIITLTQPDGTLIAKLGMPFFQALPLNLATVPQGVLVYPSAGPYYWASRGVGQQITVKRNPFYTGARPANADEFDITVGTNLDQSLLQVKSNQVDYDLGGLPPTAHADLGLTYGVNTPNGQYHVNPLLETDYVALNTSRAPFSNLNLRKAANFAVDRPALNNLRGAYAGTPTDQILPPGMGGFRDAQVYPLDGPQYDTARSLAGNSCGTVKLWGSSNAIGQALLQVFKNNLEQIGCTVQVTLFAGFQLFLAAGHRGADFDAVLTGWNQEYPDPYDFLDILLNGNNIHDDGNNNLAYFDDPTINAKLAQANQLVGAARYQAYGDLDVEITTEHAPWVAYANRNAREFTAARIGGYLLQPANASADLNTFFIQKTPQSISFAALANKTYGDADFTVSASASSGLAVSFAASGNCTVSGATVHITAAGSCTVTASQPGDATYFAAPNVLQSFAIAKAGQTITFGSLADKTFGDPDFADSATASSGLPVTFAASGNCTVAGATVHITGVGSCTLTASQPGDANYNAAAAVSQSFAIAKAGQTIMFGSLADKTFGDPDFAVSATASSGLPVTFAASGNCTVAGATVHITGAGSCTVSASQPGDANYNAAAAVAQSFAIARPDQTITFGSLADKSVGNPDFAVSATASSGLAVTFAASGNCTVAGPMVHITGAGSCTVTASQPGDANYNAAAAVSQSFSITPLKPPTNCVVPNVIGKRLASAKLSITTKHCRTGTVSYSYSRKSKKGVVVSQSRRPGRVLPAKSKIDLVVSRGRRA